MPQPTFSPTQWRKIEELYLAASALPRAEREALLDEACVSDAVVRREVESILALESQAENFLEDAEGDWQAISAPQRIGPYRILREIGHGGMGAVYLARRDDGEFQQRVAIKIVRQGFAGDFVRRRFRHEREILARLAHPNIARLLDGGTTADGVAYLVMEYVEGEPVDKYCARLPLAARLELFEQVCAAVQYAHQNLVVHRDLKPDNILVDRDGAPKLLDFGIAKLLDAEHSPAERTLTGQRALTPEYASPEQVAGDTITTASDVYSLGVLLYVLLTGQSPYRFKNHSLQEIARVIGEQEPLPPSKIVARGAASLGAGFDAPDKLERALKGDLDTIVLKAMRKEPAARYASVEQLAADLQRHLQGLPVAAHKATWRYRGKKFIQRHWAGIAAAAAVLLFLVVGIAVALYSARQERLAKTQAERQRQTALELAQFTLNELQNSFASLPGATLAREQTLRRLIGPLEAMVKNQPDDWAAQQVLADLYTSLSNILGNDQGHNLGDPHGSLEIYRKAAAIYERLIAANPRHLAAKRRLGEIYDQIARWLGNAAQQVESVEFMHKMIAVYESLSKEPPSEINLQGSIHAVAYEKAASYLVQESDFKRALVWYQKAKEFYEDKLRGNKCDDCRQRLALIYYGFGNLHRRQRHEAELITWYKESLRMYQSLPAPLQKEVEVQKLMAMVKYRLGEQLVEKKLETEEGLKLCREANETYRTLSQANVADSVLFNSRIGALGALGRAMTELKRHDEAVKYCREACQVAQDVVSRDPANMQNKRLLSKTYYHLGWALFEARRLVEADEALHVAREVPEEVLAKNPYDEEMGTNLARIRLRLGKIHEGLALQRGAASVEVLAHWREARIWYERSYQQFQQLIAHGYKLPSLSEEIENAAHSMAKCDVALANKKTPASSGSASKTNGTKPFRNR